MLDQMYPFLAVFGSGWTATWPTQLLALIWIAWLVSWAVGSFFSGRTEKRVMTGDSLAFHLPIIVGAVLMTPWTAQILDWRAPDGQQVDGYSADIEEATEGVMLSAQRAAVYLELVRQAAGRSQVKTICLWASCKALNVWKNSS